jgi:hypothetical protein
MVIGWGDDNHDVMEKELLFNAAAAAAAAAAAPHLLGSVEIDHPLCQ